MNLSPTEKKALLGYLRNPSADPTELSDILDISYWTLMKARKRLIEKGVMRFIWVPDFKVMGASIIFSGFGSIKSEGRAPQVSSDMVFFTTMENKKGFGIGLAKDYNTLYKEFLRFSERFGYLRAEKFGVDMIPVETADIWRFADFYPLLSKDLNMEVEFIEKEYGKTDITLRRSEKDVYMGIISHPDWTGEMIAKELGTSRQRVLRLKEKFERSGLIRKKAIVDLKNLGYEVLLFVTWRMRPSIYRKMYENINKYPLNPIILGISTPIQGMAMAAFRSFRESRETIERLSSWANPEETLIGEPDTLFMSIQDSNFPKYFDFSGVAKTILNTG